jgi:hypothetical protein
MFIGKLETLRLELDFSKSDNQVLGAIEMGDLPDNFVIQSVSAQRIGTLTSSGSATILIGNAADADGYVAADVRAQTDKNVVRGKGALVWDSTDKHPVEYPVLEANKAVKATVATAAITAGKIAVYLTGFYATQH